MISSVISPCRLFTLYLMHTYLSSLYLDIQYIIVHFAPHASRKSYLLHKYTYLCSSLYLNIQYIQYTSPDMLVLTCTILNYNYTFSPLSVISAASVGSHSWGKLCMLCPSRNGGLYGCQKQTGTPETQEGLQFDASLKRSNISTKTLLNYSFGHGDILIVSWT